MRRTLLPAGLALVLAVGACASSTPAPAPAPEPTAAPTASGPLTASRQDAGQVERTLASLRRVDELPLYEMTYDGAYDPTVGTDAGPARPFGCSLFAAAGDPGRPLFARNFDWDANPALVLRTDPPDAYASISVVDMSYLDVDADPAGDRRLLNAPLLPFDGMNERGLAVGLAADDGARADLDPGRATVGSVRILRLVLDRAATVDEAVAVFQRYNVDFQGGPPLHYLIADAGGASAVVEFVDGRLRVERGSGGWRALTNVPVVGVAEQRRREDRRYRTIAEALDRSGGVADAAAALKILADVRQAHTRWSVTYDLRGGEVRLTTAAGGAHSYRLPMT
ncbi:linear amide C-N hydrolase [Micromonospora sp. NPDC047074]|uniref:linear amide C-N hydrolase n=1 Tax=Micromonospora sp. NPDC047074 TaxID=3154339 RepID=UPI0033E634CA